MHCDWDTPALFLNQPVDDVRGTFAAEKAIRLLAETPAGASRSEIFSQLDRVSRFTFAAYQHELDHCRRVHGTTFGLLYRSFRDSTVRSFQRLAPTYTADLDRVTDAWTSSALIRFNKMAERATIAEIAGALRECGPEVAEQMLARGYQQCLRLLCTGRSNARDAGMAQIAAKVHLGDAFHIVSPEEALLTLVPSAGTVIPNTELILEILAALQHLNWAILVVGDSGDSDPVVGMLSENNIYRDLLALWSSNFPKSFASSFRPNYTTAFVTPALTTLPVEFYALAEVSLMVPFLPSGLPTTRMWGWADLCPGKRFLVGMKQLVDANTHMTSIADPAAPERFTEIVSLICRNYEWPEPCELAAAWRDREHSPGMFIANQHDDGMHLAADMMRLRIQAPLRTAIGSFLQDDAPIAHFSMWLTRQPDGLEPRSTIGGSMGDHAWSRFYLVHVAKALLFDGHHTMHKLRPTRQEEALRYALNQATSSAPDDTVRAVLARWDELRPISL